MTHDTLRSAPVGVPGPSALLDVVVRRRAWFAAGYLGASLLVVAALGRPDRPAVLWWIGGLVVITCVGTERGIRRFLIDWLPVLVIAAGYDTVRAQAPDLLTRAVVRPQLRFDEIAFGGTAPTVRLQQWLGVHPGSVHAWDFAVWLCYLSHFVTTFVIAAYLYITDRARFRRAAILVVTVSVAGFATYFVLPAVPPWLASRQGALPHTTRVVHEVWGQLGLPRVAKVFNGDAQFANPVAALPSLHAAWPLMMLLFFWPTARRGRLVLVAYNVAMAFVLVYGAEHYVSDLLLGWCYTIVVLVVWNRVWGRHDHEVTPALARS